MDGRFILRKPVKAERIGQPTEIVTSRGPQWARRWDYVITIGRDKIVVPGSVFAAHFISEDSCPATES